MVETARPLPFQEKVENTYSLATASHLDASTIYSAGWPLSMHVRVADQAGYNGVELWPQRPVSFEIDLNLLNDRTKKKVTSVHQSPLGKLKDPRSIQTAAFLPELNHSEGALEKIREQVGDVPAVLFREVSPKYLETTKYSYKQIQTDPETAYKWGLSEGDSQRAAEEYVRIAKLRGFDGIVVDTHHIRRTTYDGKPNPLGNWRKSIPVLLPHCREIHIGIGRSDYKGMDAEKVDKEIDDLLGWGPGNSELEQMLRFIAERDWKGLVVLEMRPTTVRRRIGVRGLILPKSELINVYTDFRGSLFNIFGN